MGDKIIDRTVRKNLASFLVGMSILFFASREIPRHTVFSPSDSVGYHLFYFKPVSVDQIQKGDFVIFPIHTDLIPHCNPCKVVKKVGCVEGEKLKTTQEGAYYCESDFLGMAKSKTGKGIPLKRFEYDGFVPGQSIFASSGHKDGYDSRYFGFVRKDQVVGKAIPLL